LYSVLTGWSVTSRDERGRREHDSNLRDLFRALDRVNQKAEHEGDNLSRDMNAMFQQELQSFRKRILQKEERQSQTQSDAKPDPQSTAESILDKTSLIQESIPR